MQASSPNYVKLKIAISDRMQERIVDRAVQIAEGGKAATLEEYFLVRLATVIMEMKQRGDSEVTLKFTSAKEYDANSGT